MEAKGKQESTSHFFHHKERRVGHGPPPGTQSDRWVLKIIVTCCQGVTKSVRLQFGFYSHGLKMKERATNTVTIRGTDRLWATSSWFGVTRFSFRLVAATAGVDHQVLLWNPYVTSKPVCGLVGHAGPVTAVCFMHNQQRLLSYSRDKVRV